MILTFIFSSPLKKQCVEGEASFCSVSLKIKNAALIALVLLWSLFQSLSSVDGTKLLLNKITFSISIMQPKTARINIIRATIRQWTQLIISKYLRGYINLKCIACYRSKQTTSHTNQSVQNGQSVSLRSRLKMFAHRCQSQLKNMEPWFWCQDMNKNLGSSIYFGKEKTKQKTNKKPGYYAPTTFILEPLKYFYNITNRPYFHFTD